MPAAVPVEVHPHAPQGVGVDLLARRADDDGRLEALLKPPHRPRRRVVERPRNTREAVAVDLLAPAARGAAQPVGPPPVVLDARDGVVPVELSRHQVEEREVAPRAQARAVALARRGHGVSAQLLELSRRVAARERALVELRVVIEDVEPLLAGGLLGPEPSFPIVSSSLDAREPTDSPWAPVLAILLALVLAYSSGRPPE